MNLNHIFLCFLFVVLIAAVAHAQSLATFNCDKGICTTTEEDVLRIQTVIGQLLSIIEQQKKESCT